MDLALRASRVLRDSGVYNGGGMRSGGYAGLEVRRLAKPGLDVGPCEIEWRR